MSQVEFEEFDFKPFNRLDNSSKMVRCIIKLSCGLIKDKKQAEYLLVAFSFALIVFSLFCFANLFISQLSTKSPTGDFIEQAGSPSEISF
ncbi:hypothetical protein A3I18_00420 [Candidatus Campbellbacteria bacterium RIFCSPLOWO2_02_FULL_35_11]|uniref:Uncharacterized protein n=2 Tax=Candidatus Campbelliibacteriota TaxID=1752727 RepID=A0A1F5EL56_9BACT|nr:MAG: hypothetical protein A3E89_02450 [Candidatus Campbellbacteria bacterium RIFCSPHIGHO2_12_FULL_35_10]OGD70506.1 MAG: hypothetical protein A3I18_00420 [Candidatus Campbellbacteria bacterium RIFCSPLOWO2_02_FULL_35_11]